MVDRILHIGYVLSGQYDKDLLQRAAEVYIYKGPAALVPHLTAHENMPAAEAETLAQKLALEMHKVNRQVMWQYAAIAVVFSGFVIAGIFSESYIFAGLFLLPLLLLLRSCLKFIRHNPLR